ncbi:hypothetical protein DL96DRAFT_1671751 [Flagelloscypha sp. PMI_526]|nr:hypothetical protein DL96DRAFT_1671751 [Flagelloscypha sp. PMI_526]
MCIPSNPDIVGVGVRTATYAQNLLSFVPALWALWDKEVEQFELESVETQSTTILITAFAILISAIVQALTLGLTNFHATIILNLSWMNNTNTFIWFLLYAQHKNWSSWQALKHSALSSFRFRGTKHDSKTVALLKEESLDSRWGLFLLARNFLEGKLCKLGV